MGTEEKFPFLYTKPAIEVRGIDPSFLAHYGLAHQGASSGFGNARHIEPTGYYNKSECERVVSLDDLEGKSSGCAVILGRDRPSTLMSGYGGTGDTQAFAIRLVAGFGACNPGIFEKQGYWPDVDPKTGDKLLINPSNKYDGAMIYLSSKTDIDENFYITEGSLGKMLRKRRRVPKKPTAPKRGITGRSAVAIKADAVRIISRDGGIKLIANTDKYHTGGFKTRMHSTIDFIVNNDDADLQPLVKGDNLVSYLMLMKKWIDELRTSLSNFAKMQMKLNMVIGEHSHKLPANAPMGAMSTGAGPVPLGVPHTVKTWELAPENMTSFGPLPDPLVHTLPDTLFLGWQACATNAEIAKGVETKLIAKGIKLDGLERNYLWNLGPTYILSSNVNTT